MARLTDRTWVRNPEGVLVLLREGTVLPEWAEGLVGDHLLDSVVSKAEPVTAPSESPAGSEGSGAPDNSAGDDEGGAGEVSAKPPLTGRGSGLGPWLAYAAEVGVDVPEGAKKDDVVGLVEAAGK